MKCPVDNVEFDDSKGKKYCSNRCKQKAHRLSVTEDVAVTPAVTHSAVTRQFEFTVTLGPKDEEREIVKAKNKPRTAKYWYDVPLGAIPIYQKDWPKMPEYMNGRQYFLWWKNNFKLTEDGLAIIQNPIKKFDGEPKYEMGGESSRRWGA